MTNETDMNNEAKQDPNLVPMPKGRKSQDTTPKVDSAKPLSTDTMSLDRESMKNLLEDTVSGINVTDLAAGRTTPKSSSSLQQEERQPLKIYCYNCRQKLDVTYMEPFSHFDCPSCGEDLIVPQWFDNFLLEEKIGIGGMAEVFRALDLTLDREVAIKILNAELYETAESREMFLNEARMAANISSHAVVPIYTCGVYNNLAYIVMQFMPGQSLENVIHEQGASIPIPDAVKWMKDVAEGLNTASLANVVHHDIKPGNLMLDSENRVKICDFGLSRAVGDTLQAATLGWVSPHYVSPEKLTTGNEDFRGDVYSFGATFYHIFSGQTPFHGSNIEEIMRDRLHRDAVPVRNLRPEIPIEISDLIMAMLNRDPAMRPAYTQIIDHINLFMMNTIQQKKGNMKKIIVNKNRQEPVPYVQSNSSTGTLRIVSLVAAVVVGIFFVVDSNFFTEPMKPFNTIKGLFVKPKLKVPKDYLPNVTQAFKYGDLEQAKFLTKEFLKLGSENIDAVKEAMLQLSMVNYLSKSKNAPKVSRHFVNKLNDIGVKKDIIYYVISYLTNDGISESELKSKLNNKNSYNECLVATAILIKNIYSNASAEQITRKFAELEKASEDADGEFWGNAWKKRFSRWKRAMERSRYASVEPVFKGVSMALTDSDGNIAYSNKTLEDKRKAALRKAIRSKLDKDILVGDDSDGYDVEDQDDEEAGKVLKRKPKIVDISYITTPKLEANRKKFSARPKPLDFYISEAAVKKYLSKLSKGDKELEEKRIKRINALRDYAVHANNRSPLSISRIKLRNGKVIKGSRITLTPDFISIKVGGSYKRIKWGSITYEQFLEFLLSYAKRKESIKVSSAIMSKSNLKKDIAMDYFNIAILCDWYGDYKNCVKYLKKTVKVDPRFGVPISILFAL